MLADGHGLYLRITDRRTKGWIFRYQVAGQRHDMGLGSVDDVSLAEARERAHELRRLLWQGVDPISDRRAKRSTARAAALKTKSFMECAELYIADHKAAWKSAKHRSQWENTLKTYAYPIIGKLGVHMIDTALVTEIVRPIWATKSATASRLRGRIELILDWAKVQGFRHGENPARWKGHLDALLPKPGEVHRTKHHAALPYAEINKFAVDLRRYDGVNARALEFAMLVGARTSEVIHMKWPEVDLARRLWTVPAERMKMKKKHRVPLSDRRIRDHLGHGGDPHQRLRVSRQKAGQAAGGQCAAADARADGPQGRHHDARLSVDILRLVRRADALSGGGSQDGNRPRRRRQGRGGIPPCRSL